MAMVPSDSSHHGAVDNSPNGFTQGRREEARKLGPSWYFSRKEIEEHSPSRRDDIDLKKECSLRKSYCSFLQDLGMKLKVPQVTIATATVFCHRFFLRQSHAKNDRRIIATVCMFLAGKVEETPRPLKDVILVSYELIHKKDSTAGQRIKQQKEIYDKQKELILLGERIVLVTLGFDLNIDHAYKPLVEAIRRFNVGSKSSLPQVAWNFVNDGLRTSLCLQFEPHHIAAGAIFLAAKFLKVKLPSDGDKVWWQDFDVTPRQLEEKNKSGGKSDAGMDRFCHEKSPPGHHYSKVSHESHNPVEEQKPHQSHDNPNERIDGILGGNEVPGVSTSRIDAMNKIDKGKVKAALEKRRKTKGDITTKVDVMDDDDLLERELEHGVELAIEDEKIKQDKMQNLSHIKDKKITQDNMQN
ncbi:Cyclin-T1-5, partial [Zea mays]